MKIAISQKEIDLFTWLEEYEKEFRPEELLMLRNHFSISFFLMKSLLEYKYQAQNKDNMLNIQNESKFKEEIKN